MMAKEFEMSMIGELSFFLRLQIKQMKEGTFVSQTKYIKDMLKKFGMEDAKGITTPMSYWYGRCKRNHYWSKELKQLFSTTPEDGKETEADGGHQGDQTLHRTWS
jgi:hypothetical protein